MSSPWQRNAIARMQRNTQVDKMLRDLANQGLPIDQVVAQMNETNPGYGYYAQRMYDTSPEIRNLFSAVQLGIQDEALQDKTRFLEALLPQTEVTPQSVADRRLEELLFEKREGHKFSDGKMAEPGRMIPGLNLPDGILPAPISTTQPGIDPNINKQLDFMTGLSSAIGPAAAVASGNPVGAAMGAMQLGGSLMNQLKTDPAQNIQMSGSK